jgi:hypothetical protein
MMGPADALGWAKKPRSREAIANVRELSSKDRRFHKIWQDLVEARVVTPEGKPLVLWDGLKWVAI